MKKNNIFKKLSHHYQLTILALPALLLLFLFNYIPMFGIIIAFKDLNYIDGILKSPWAGLDNFRFLFLSNDAFIATRNTLVYNLVFIIIGTVISLVFAIMMNELKNQKQIKLYQTIFFFPYFFSWVIVSYMLYSYMADPFGIIINVLKQFGISDFNFYSEIRYWPVTIILVGIWKGVGYTSVIYYAGIMGISSEYYEAATIDGATRLQIITKITLPLIKPLITIMVLLSIGKIFYADFGLFFFLPRGIGTLYPVTQVLDTYVYRALRNTGDIGMAAAAGLFQSVMGFGLIIISNYIVRKTSPENSLF